MKRDIFAIVGATASGKSDLALSLAKELNGVILSVDSLSIYKEIDIASAKPSKDELKEILHFGVDEIYPNEKFDVTRFIEIFNRAKEFSKRNKKRLIIVGGTSFYLKVLTDGISQLPKIQDGVRDEVKRLMQNQKEAYSLLKKVDLDYSKKIKEGDRYRIEKALELYFQTKIKPTEFFKIHPPKPLVDNLEIYEIDIDRELLRERIKLRTNNMVKAGLVDEVFYLEKRYTRAPNPIKAIGIKETLEFLDGRLNLNELKERISINTARLAKRQTTFNRTQLKIKLRASRDELFKTLTSP
jgi:tRNA dimethylallyltransferase